MKNTLKFPKDILKNIENHLIDENQKIVKHITELKKQDPFSDTDRLMDNAASDTEAKEEVNHERYEAILTELTKQKAAVDAALTRIKNGTFGFCTSCKNLIDTDRLGAIPTATLCMSCGAKKKK